MDAVERWCPCGFAALRFAVVQGVLQTLDGHARDSPEAGRWPLALDRRWGRVRVAAQELLVAREDEGKGLAQKGRIGARLKRNLPGRLRESIGDGLVSAATIATAMESI